MKRIQGITARRGYPRGCGGTAAAAGLAGSCQGLSPRLRGNLGRVISYATIGGAIPAVAGEPPASSLRRSALRGYPRGCGGTSNIEGGEGFDWGLSPRLRGNRGSISLNATKSGAIPAVAGEPCLTVRFYALTRGYPRGCGGTALPKLFQKLSPGLSPRLRGNHIRPRRHILLEGAIPAVAGEPAINRGRCPPPGGYPRGCGGTVSDAVMGTIRKGLSPRLRGNLTHPAAASARCGAIPAVAGEPPIPCR